MNMNDLAEELNRKVQEKIKENAGEKVTINNLLNKENIKNRINILLGSKTEYFISSILTVVRENIELQECDPYSILGSAIISATLDLPIEPNLGFAYIVPFTVSVAGEYKKVAKFLIGYKGYIQLAIRSGAYKTINASEVYEGEIKSYNRFTGEITLGNPTSKNIVGYIAYFKLLNGFEKYVYMSKEQVVDHAKKFSKTFYRENSVWRKHFDSMATKTVIKKLLSKFGILSIQMQGALINDNAIRLENEEGKVNLLQEDFINEFITEEGEILKENEFIQEGVKRPKNKKTDT